MVDYYGGYPSIFINGQPICAFWANPERYLHYCAEPTLDDLDRRFIEAAQHNDLGTMIDINKRKTRQLREERGRSAKDGEKQKSLNRYVICNIAVHELAKSGMDWDLMVDVLKSMETVKLTKMRKLIKEKRKLFGEWEGRRIAAEELRDCLPVKRETYREVLTENQELIETHAKRQIESKAKRQEDEEAVLGESTIAEKTGKCHLADFEKRVLNAAENHTAGGSDREWIEFRNVVAREIKPNTEEKNDFLHRVLNANRNRFMS